MNDDVLRDDRGDDAHIGGRVFLATTVQGFLPVLFPVRLKVGYEALAQSVLGALGAAGGVA